MLKNSTVIFHWENHKSLNTPHAIKKLLNRWSFTCKAFGVYNLIAVTKDTLQLNDAEIKFDTAETLEEALKDKKDIIYLEVGGEPLDGFKHPKNATYVFGSDFGGLHVDNAITIATNNALHAEVACGVILYDRSIQHGI